MPEPLVSVIIPVYNGERFLAEAIDSVLAQDHAPIEVIVVDDGSTDASSDIARGYGSPVRLLRQDNAGIAAARNTGIAASTGELLAPLDADDTWTPGRLAKQLAELAATPELDGAFGLVQTVFESGAEETYRVVAADAAGGPMAGSMLVRRESFMRAGFFRPELRVGEFIEWYARALDVGLRFVTLEDVLLLRRIHGANTTIQAAGNTSGYARALKSVLDRRRGSQA